MYKMDEKPFSPPLLLILILLFLISSKIVEAQTTQNINVLYLNEEGNAVADKAIDVAVAYVTKNPKLGVKVLLKKAVGNRTDSEGFLSKLCTVYGAMYSEKTYPHLVLDTTMTGMASEAAKAFTKALALPTVTASFGQKDDLRSWRAINQEETRYLIQIMPPADVIPELIRSIVASQGISNAAILHDPSFVMDHKYKSLLQNVATRHVIAPIQEADIKQQITKLLKLDIMNYFLLASLANIKRVLDVANAMNLYSRKYAWHAITQDKSDLQCNCKNATIIFAKPIIDNAYQDRLGTIRTTYQLNSEPQIASAFYFDLALHSFLAVKNLIAEGGWPKNMKYITCDQYDKRSPDRKRLNLKKYLEKENTEPFTYGKFNMTENGASYMEFQMQLSAVGVRDGSSDKSITLGRWNAALGNNISFVNPNIMENLTADLIYKVATVLQYPFVIKDETSPSGYIGYCIDLIDEIANILNFKYEIYVVDDNKFGNMDDNGNWNGIVRELLEKKADIGLGSMSVMAERENVIDFTVPFYDLVGITILMKLPKPTTSLFKFLTVLENDVWLCILAAYFFTSFLIWVFDRWSPYSYQNNREQYRDDEEKREFNLKECFWFCMTSLTPQGGGEAPKNLSGRLVAATWWLFGFIIIASYTANLAAFLTVSRLETPVESLDDLSKQYKIQYAPMNDTSVMIYFKRMADIEARFYEIWKDMSLNDSLSDIERAKLAVWDYPVSDKYTKMWQSMKEAGLPKTLEEAVVRVRASRTTNEGFAYVGDATDIRYLTLTNCDLQMVGEEFSRKPYAVAVQQGSPLKDQLNAAILQLLNKRQLERFKEKWWSGNAKAQTCEQQEDQSDGISIQNIGGVFIVIFVGIALACCTLAFEYYWYKYRKGVSIVNVEEIPKKPADHKDAIGRDINFKRVNPPGADHIERLKMPRVYPRSRF